jgi:IclR family KDG regulon transcriptional repressor
LLKGLSVLELPTRSDRALSLTQIGRELRMAKSNVHRLMQALVETRFVLREEESGSYTVSIKLWELRSAVLAKRRAASPIRGHSSWRCARCGSRVTR